MYHKNCGQSEQDCIGHQLSLLNVDLLELHKKYKYSMPKSDITLESFSSIKIDNRKVRNITVEPMRHQEHFYIKRMNKTPSFAYFSADI